MIAIAIDDEPVALEVIKSHASKVPFIDLQTTFTNAFEAIIYLQSNKVDLLFLDIKMPDINGIEFLKSLSNPPLVVFTTAYSEHAVKGFELDAVDYLLKPFSLARFLKACSKANVLFNSRTKNISAAQQPLSIFIKDGYEQVKVFLDEVIYIEAGGNYTQLHLIQNKLLSTRLPVNEMILMLPQDQFIRIHRTFIVAKNKVTRFDKTQVWLGDISLPIGATYASSLQQLY